MNTLRKLFTRTASHARAFELEWSRQRAQAQRFGPSHVAEVDAIFQRHS